MSISIGGSQSASLSYAPGAVATISSTAALSSAGTAATDGQLIAALELNASGVSAALQDLSSALGSIINTLA